MRASDTSIVYKTDPHSPHNQTELERLNTEWTVRARIQEQHESSGKADSKSPPTRAEVQAALRDSGLDVFQTDMVLRAMVREKEIEAAMAPLLGTGSGSSSGASAKKRRQSVIAPRFGSSGPLTLSVRYDENDDIPGDNPAETPSTEFAPDQSKITPGVGGRRRLSGATGGEAPTKSPVTLQMTRSIGDWDAARAMIPHPHIERFTVPPDGHMRVVLASDGLWDVISDADVSLELRNAISARVAMEQLARVATKICMQRFGKMKDDTSIICVDMNPSGRPVVPVKAEGCCVVS